MRPNTRAGTIENLNSYGGRASIVSFANPMGSTQLNHAPQTPSTIGRAGTAMTIFTEDGHGLTTSIPKPPPPLPPPESLDEYLNREAGKGGASGEMAGAGYAAGHLPVEAWPPVDSADAAQDCEYAQMQTFNLFI